MNSADCLIGIECCLKWFSKLFWTLVVIGNEHFTIQQLLHDYHHYHKAILSEGKVISSTVYFAWQCDYSVNVPAHS